MSAYPIRTARLTVRIMGSRDIPTLLAYRNDPQVAELQAWELAYTEADAEWLTRQDGLTDVADQGWTQLAIDLEGKHIGDVAVCLDETGRQANIGFTLAREHWGRGLAREAAYAVVADLVDRRGVVRLTGECDPRNLGSMRTLEAIGLVHSHDAQQSYLWRGAWADTTYYGVTASAWQSWRDRPTGAPAELALVRIESGTARAWQRVQTHHTQRRFVATVADSYADALFPEDWRGAPLVPVLRGLLADGERVGFLMYAAVTPSMPIPYLWRLLVDRRHQGRGIGTRALHLLARELLDSGSTTLWLTFVEGPGSPRDFYLGLGAQPTGEIVDGETVAVLDLAQLGA